MYIFGGRTFVNVINRRARVQVLRVAQWQSESVALRVPFVHSIMYISAAVDIGETHLI